MGPCISGNSNTKDKIKGAKINIGQHILILQQKIAQGAYGDIWKCKDAKTGEQFAAKQIKIQNNQLQKMYKKQQAWLSRFQNVPGVVKYVGSKLIQDESAKTPRSHSTGIIVTQFYQISLFDELKNRKLQAHEIVNVLKQLLNTLQKIHEAGCLHLDLKLQNVLCKNSHNGNRFYHICDFGSCMQGPINVEQMQKKQKTKLKQFIQANSTLIYRAPEMIDPNKIPITAKADIWMIGCIAYLLLFRKHPFEGQGQLGIVTGIVDYSLNPQISNPSEDNDIIIKRIIQCIKGMLETNVDKRLNEEKALQLLNL